MNLFNLILLASSPDEAAFGGMTAGEVATIGIYIALILLAIAAFIAFIGPLIFSVLNFKDGWKGWAAMIGFGLLALGAYTIGGGNETLANYAAMKEVTPGQFKLINGILYLFFILLFVATVMFLLSIVKDVISGFVK